ncbi:hypothetical protein CIW49_26265 [Mycolicibacterium sp. P1-18]|uniref:hypothetical protein n=1 Tax=Mycolicibacterium sp. P1-18 TaxID=2024615 RepID=UPI0011F3A82F|nr:hypothetical protein [Mycolicibacterium sp. P1-18]KAA0093570.1 hypothetical protein CIW49_26265 [Mycolicibacterium sp. P1-18]
MSVAAIEYACAVLGRAHALFGDSSTPSTPLAGGGSLSGAADRNAAARHAATLVTGRLPASVDAFGADAARRLEHLAGADDQLEARTRAAALADHAGRGASGRVLAAATTDVGRLAARAGSPAGQRALLVALRDRVSRQRQVVAAYHARDARMAALLRTLSYSSGPSGGAPLGSAGSRGPSHGPPGRTTLPVGRTRAVPAVGPSAPTGSPGRLAPTASPQEVARVLVEQCRRRGYSPAQTCAILATMLQESGGNPRAASRNGLWRGLFQQDAGYPGRDDPNAAISGFLDRLGAKGGPASPDVWKSIFWLQQAPGMASADAALASGRQGYLREIQSQLARAVTMYRKLGAG